MKTSKLRACMNCRYLTDGDRCPLCGSEDLTENWQDVLLVVDPNSEMAKLAKIDKQGIFAVFLK